MTRAFTLRNDIAISEIALTWPRHKRLQPQVEVFTKGDEETRAPGSQPVPAPDRKFSP
jgi:hypothetical protein